MLSGINPFYRPRVALPQNSTKRAGQYALLPEAPVNGSPVPHLTSLYHFHAGEYGSRRYPGNCGGNLIRDLLLYFQPRNLFDPMTGSGTCADVCRELSIPCISKDIRQGFDATSPASYAELAGQSFEFIWAHPPYWRQKLYTQNPGDLSQTASLDQFLAGYGKFIRLCSELLSPSGKFAILMGDYHDRKAGFVSLTYATKKLAFRAGLRQACTDIIRFSHGASSSRKTYRSPCIPGLHDVCMVFEKSAEAPSIGSTLSSPQRSMP